MDLCNWIKTHPELLSVILFSDEASFTRDGVNNLRNVHTWSHDNPHGTSVTNFQRRFTVNVWCGVLGNKLIGPYVFDNNFSVYSAVWTNCLYKQITFRVYSVVRTDCLCKTDYVYCLQRGTD